MVSVGLNWTPSASAAVDQQDVQIRDVNTSVIYGQAVLGPEANEFYAECPEGALVQGVVVTVRGTEQVPSLSNQLQIPYAPLQGATNLNLDVVVAVQPLP